MPALTASELKQLSAGLLDFLGAPTPAAWIGAAVDDLPLLLVDHANCEKKAAASAMSMLFRYDRRRDLCAAMSRLAREELRHFEQVLALMERRGITYRELSASRYAAGLRAAVRGAEPHRLLDLLVCGAFVEARSCERFARLIPHLDDELARFYGRLVRSEARHYETYLALARPLASAEELAERIAAVRSTENALITSPDGMLRFHSGPLQADGANVSRTMPAASARA